ncbi:phosphopantetheine-binding protein [Saccharothrix longispora]|uniref:phosphopantetheine-binding protein n=1 Tax=Saccharothrix longispora TaxID=33920 RepID=UPI0028FD3545|nr:phosphopantetheine-binding protein [Saccharothrix longispora]MDU0292794.1 phosphopantetheine-binding protein [Saccharothrix longispora]
MTREQPAVAEEHVAQIWKEVLGAPDAPPEATFFELGGQSISAVRIAARIEEEIGVSVDIGDLFEDPDLTTFIRDVLAKARATADSSRA